MTQQTVSHLSSFNRTNYNSASNSTQASSAAMSGLSSATSRTQDQHRSAMLQFFLNEPAKQGHFTGLGLEINKTNNAAQKCNL
jgi:hypothetical protein